MRKDLGDPDVMFVDVWPLQAAMVTIWTHDVAEQLSRATKDHKYSINKSPTMHEFDSIMGVSSMLSANVSIAWTMVRIL